MQSKIKRKLVSLMLAASFVGSPLATFPMQVFAGTGSNGVMMAPTIDQQQQLRNLQTQLTEAQGQLTTVQAANADLQAQLETTQSTLASTKSDLEATQSNLETTQSNLETTQSNLETTQSELETTKSELETTKSNLETTQSELETTKSNLETTQSELETTKSNLETTQSELETTKSNLETTQSELETTKSNLETTQSELETVQNDLTQAQNDLTAAQSTLASMQSTLVSTQSDLATTKSTLASTQSTLQKVLEELEKLKQKVTGVTIDNIPANNEIDISQEFTLTAKFSPECAYEDYKKVTWTSNDENVATVDENGIVKAIAPGEATITATAKNGSTNEDDWRTASVDITVLQPVTAVTISGAPANSTMDVNKTCTLTANFLPEDAYADYKKVTWTSNDENVATVDENGIVKAIAPGTVTMTATAKNGSENSEDWITTSVNITVLQPVTAVTISGAPANSTMDVNKTCTLTANFLPADAYADYKKVEWSSDNTDVATVAEDGKVTALKAGTAKITATAKNGSTNEDDWRTASVDITVLQPVTAVTISGAPANSTMDVNKTCTLTANLSPDDVSEEYQTVTWSSNDENVATVDQTGKVKAIAPGQVTITATAKNGSTNEDDWKSMSVDITVLQPVTAVTISGAPANSTMDVNKTCTLTANFLPEDAYADYKKVEWSSDNTDVATVAEDGKVTALKAGTAKITATTANGLSATCQVFVGMVVIRYSYFPNTGSTSLLNGPKTYFYEPVKLTITGYWGCNHPWATWVWYKGTKLIVASAYDSNIRIEKCVFHYRDKSAEVTESPYEHGGWNENGVYRIDQVDVYFTRNN